MNWLNTEQAAARANRHPVTVRRAASSGELHSHQPLRSGRPVRGARLSFHPAAVDAWVRGLDEPAQRQACGCPQLRSVRRPA